MGHSALRSRGHTRPPHPRQHKRHHQQAERRRLYPSLVCSDNKVVCKSQICSSSFWQLSNSTSWMCKFSSAAQPMQCSKLKRTGHCSKVARTRSVSVHSVSVVLAHVSDTFTAEFSWQWSSSRRLGRHLGSGCNLLLIWLNTIADSYVYVSGLVDCTHVLSAILSAGRTPWLEAHAGREAWRHFCICKQV